MNRQQFYHWMDDPASLNAESLPELQQLAADYPYFQSARLLHLLNLKLLQDYRFERELKAVASIMADRKRLREWLQIIGKKENLSPAEPADKRLSVVLEEQARADEHLRELEERIRASLDEIEQNKSRLNELIEEKKAFLGNSDFQKEESQEKEKSLPLRPLPKDALLEEFLMQRQNRPDGRVTFFSPEESARRSVEENDGVLSETLARLIAAQGKKDKAIKIYQQLMLKNPQKSSYFAAQIEKLRKES
jgi:hypothetical protein